MGFNPADLPDLSGRVYIVTGGNSGIGFATCRHLAAHNARVYMGARSADKARKAIQDIKYIHPHADVRHLSMEQTSFASVVAAASTFQEEETRLHGLINNAGIMGKEYEISRDGFELTWQTNYLSHWLLVEKLLPTMLATASDPSTLEGTVRIVNTSSGGHVIFSPSEGIAFADTSLEKRAKMTRYGQSKLANVLHTKTLHDKYGPGSPSMKGGAGAIWTISTDPGPVDTQMNQEVRVDFLNWIYPVMKILGVYSTSDQGAVSNLFGGASDKFKKEWSGGYMNCKGKYTLPSKQGQDEELKRKLEKWTSDQMKQGGWVN